MLTTNLQHILMANRVHMITIYFNLYLICTFRFANFTIWYAMFETIFYRLESQKYSWYSCSLLLILYTAIWTWLKTNWSRISKTSSIQSQYCSSHRKSRHFDKIRGTYLYKNTDLDINVSIICDVCLIDTKWIELICLTISWKG